MAGAAEESGFLGCIVDVRFVGVFVSITVLESWTHDVYSFGYMRIRVLCVLWFIFTALDFILENEIKYMCFHSDEWGTSS